MGHDDVAPNEDRDARRTARSTAIFVNVILGLFGFVPVLSWSWPLASLVDGVPMEDGLILLWLIFNGAYAGVIVLSNWAMVRRLNLEDHDLVGFYTRTSCVVLFGIWAIMAMFFFRPIRPPIPYGMSAW